MMVDLIFESGLADLVQAVKLIEVHRVAVRHDEPVKSNSQAGLTEALNSLRLSQNLRAGWNKKTQTIVGVNVVGQHADDWTGEVAIQAGDKYCLKNRSLKDDVVLSSSLIEIGVALLVQPVTWSGCRLRRCHSIVCETGREIRDFERRQIKRQLRRRVCRTSHGLACLLRTITQGHAGRKPRRVLTPAHVLLYRV